MLLYILIRDLAFLPCVSAYGYVNKIEFLFVLSVCKEGCVWDSERERDRERERERERDG